MLVKIDRLEELAAQQGPLHLALGVFDGVHLGHLAVIRRAVKAAENQGGQAFVVTFSPHPIRVLAPERAPASLLSSDGIQAEIFSEIGVDGVLQIPFDRVFSEVPAETFIRDLARADVRTIAVGDDWRFGHKRGGDVDLLGRLGQEFGYALEAVAPVMWEGERISSTRIRQAIRDGNFAVAEEMLGRPYELAGTVIEGKKLGRELGFPTANLLPGEQQLPSDGVWAVSVNRKWRGVANLGKRPTVDGVNRLLEIHVFDFSGDLYGQELRVRFRRFVRPEKKFSSLEELREQIALDVEEARR